MPDTPIRPADLLSPGSHHLPRTNWACAVPSGQILQKILDFSAPEVPGSTCSGAGSTGASVASTGPGVGSTGSVDGSKGSVIGSTGSVVGSTGSVVGSAGSVVGSTGSVVGSAGFVVGSAGSVVGGPDVRENVSKHRASASHTVSMWSMLGQRATNMKQSDPCSTPSVS